MKIAIKELLIFVYEMTYFMLISVPIASILFLTAHIYFETKRLLWKK